MIRPILIAVVCATTWFGGVHVISALCAEAMAGAAHPTVAGDRPVARPSGVECGDQAWPYYSGTCMQNHRRHEGRSKEVRFVSADRLPLVGPATLAAK